MSNFLRPGYIERAVDWDKFLQDLSEVPEIAKLQVSFLGASPLLLAMMPPAAPFAVIKRLLEINPDAANFNAGGMDGGGWMTMVGRGGDWDRESSNFITEVNPKILRLALETTTDPDVAVHTDDPNGYTPIEDFVRVDQENLTAGTRMVLELSPRANVHVLECHFKKLLHNFSLGDPALKFCMDLVNENVGNKYKESDKAWLRDLIKNNQDVSQDDTDGSKAATN